MNEKQIQTLIARMTLEEKASLCSGGDFWHTKAIERLGIPALTMSDGPSGLRKQDGSGKMGLHESKQSVSFPTGSLVAASFDRDVLTTLGETLGEEAASEDIDILLGPAMNIKRSPLCGRNFEYYSEDPTLSSKLASAYVKGLQSKGVGACPKHFYANNMENRRMTASSELDERTAREIYLASFEEMVKESKPRSIMCSYNKINGVYAAQNKEALTDILRKHWGFDGIVVSDWGAVNDRAADLAAGLDLEMPTSHGSGPKRIMEAIADGTLDEQTLDTACARILDTVFRLKNEKQSVSECDWADHHKIASEIAAESMVLLKNEGLLPLRPEQKVAFIGKYAARPRYQGGGSSHVQPWKVESALDCLGSERVTYAQGFDDETDEISPELFTEALLAAQDADVAVLFVGLPEHYESEGFDREHLKMPPNQLELIEQVCRVQKNVVVLLHNGAPVEMPWIDQVGAVLECYLGGEGVGRAQMDLLYGRKNPCGRLAESFPVRLEDNPSYLNLHLDHGKVHYREGVHVGYRYYATVKQPVLFPFGHGLSYTQFQCRDLTVKKTADTYEVSVSITNAGQMTGKEVVQLYIAPPKDSHRPVRELKDFRKIELRPGESKTVFFRLERRAFACWDEAIHDWFVEGGTYSVEIGRSSMDIAMSVPVKVIGDPVRPMPITRDTAIGDLTEEQIELVMSSFGKRAEEKQKGDRSVSETASRALQVNMPLRSLVSFGAMQEDGLQTILRVLRGE